MWFLADMGVLYMKRTKKEKILLINRGWSDNLGDQAIKYTLEELLKSYNYEVDFSDFTQYKKNQDLNYKNKSKEISCREKKMFRKVISCIIPVSTLRRISWIVKNYKIFKACFKEYDLVVIGGGQLLNSNYVFPLAMFLWVNLFELFNDSKIIIFGVGAVRNYNRFDKFLYSNALKKVDKIYMRDYESIKILSEVFNQNASYVPDVAFCINKLKSEEIVNKRNEVLIGLTDYNRYKKYYNDKGRDEYYLEWEKIILHYVDKKYNVKFFYTTVGDLTEAINMQKTILNKYKTYIDIIEVNNLDELINAISHAAVVVSPRMHALIIAYVYGCDVIPFIMSDKIKVFKEQYLDDKSISLDELQNQVLTQLMNAIN